MSAKKRSNGETRQMVLQHLMRDADLDGLVTTTSTELGSAVGIDDSTARYHVNCLVADGVLAPVSQGRYGVVAYQFAEQAMDAATHVAADLELIARGA